VSNEQSNTIRDKFGNEITMDEIQWVCQQHHLGEIKKINGVLSGKNNVPILVETYKGKYVLRYVTYPASKERIKDIEDIILCLKEASIPAVNAIQNRLGDNYTFTNNRIVQVYPFIEGIKFNFKPEQIKSNAKVLKKFHNALKLYKQDPLPDNPISLTEEYLQKRLHRLYRNKESISESSLSRIKSLYSTIIKHWKEADNNNLQETIIHCDWHPWNLIYREDGSIACILDMDHVQSGNRIYDVAYFIYWIFKFNSNEQNRKIYLEIFLDGYGGLTPEEERILPLEVSKIAFNFIIKKVSQAEKELKENEPLIQYFLSLEGKGFLH
jgi:Ser/Thr protein kinase RdoA (MazF antagonist)